MNADIKSSARVIELCYETNRAIVRFEGVPPEIGAEAVFLQAGTSAPMARVNAEGFLVEYGDLPLSPGMVLYAHLLSPPSAPIPMSDALQGLAAYLRCEAGGLFQGHPSHATLTQWATEVDAARALLASQQAVAVPQWLDIATAPFGLDCLVTGFNMNDPTQGRHTAVAMQTHGDGWIEYLDNGPDEEQSQIVYEFLTHWMPLPPPPAASPSPQELK